MCALGGGFVRDDEATTGGRATTRVVIINRSIFKRREFEMCIYTIYAFAWENRPQAYFNWSTRAVHGAAN